MLRKTGERMTFCGILVVTAAFGLIAWSPAEAADVPPKPLKSVYTERWVYHGLTNTSSEQLIFVVVRFNSKGITVPPRPDDRPDEQ